MDLNQSQPEMLSNDEAMDEQAQPQSPDAKFNDNNRLVPPCAPRNTTSFLIRARECGGIASPESPCSTPPLTEMYISNLEYDVDIYGSMWDLISLRSPAHELRVLDGENDEKRDLDMYRIVDRDVRRLEFIFSNIRDELNNDRDSYIAQLEQENSRLMEHLSSVERELDDLRRRMMFLEEDLIMTNLASHVV